MQVKSAPTMLLSRVCQPFFPSQKCNASSKKTPNSCFHVRLQRLDHLDRPVNTEHMDPFSPKLACLWGTRSWQSAETWDFQRASPPRAALSGRTSSQLAQNRNVQRLRHVSNNAFDIIWQLKVPQEVLKTPFVRAYQDWSSNTFEVSLEHRLIRIHPCGIFHVCPFRLCGWSFLAPRDKYRPKEDTREIISSYGSRMAWQWDGSLKPW